MSPKERKQLKKLRKKLDILDNSFIKLLKKRIKTILKNIKKKSLKNRIDPKISKRIWVNMIAAFIDYEKRNFKKK